MFELNIADKLDVDLVNHLIRENVEKELAWSDDLIEIVHYMLHCSGDDILKWARSFIGDSSLNLHPIGVWLILGTSTGSMEANVELAETAKS
ncbi:hypothetical protein Ancab_007768 [Ancistrocladus abbreviatus]